MSEPSLPLTSQLFGCPALEYCAVNGKLLIKKSPQPIVPVVTFTVSSKVTETFIVSPAPYVPSAVVEVTFVTLGALVSITKSLFAPNEFAAPGAGRANDALLLFPRASLMVPPFKERALEL